jgi:ubiquinone/menaquinone biosynthesis C-methylase UbiE
MENYYLDGEEKFGYFTTLFYNTIAWRVLKKLYSFTIKEINGMDPKSILDIGAGPGKLSVMVSKKYPDAKFFAIDPSEYMVKTEIKNFKKENIKAKCMLGSSRNIPLSENFDLIYTTLSFHHWKDRDSNIKYILSKLNENGTFMIIEFLQDYYKSPLSQHRKHSISKQYAESLNFDGFEKRINISGEFISIKFKRVK